MAELEFSESSSIQEVGVPIRTWFDGLMARLKERRGSAAFDQFGRHAEPGRPMRRYVSADERLRRKRIADEFGLPPPRGDHKPKPHGPAAA